MTTALYQTRTEAVKIERYPVTPERARAARDRGLLFTSEMPFILAHFDNGHHSGSVILLGLTYFQDGTPLAKVCRADAPEKGEFRVLLESVTVDGAVLEHLERAARTIESFSANGPITGRVRQGVTRNWTGGSYR